MKYKIYGVKLDRLISIFTIMHINYTILSITPEYIIVDFSNNSFRSLKKLFLFFHHANTQIENTIWSE
ncbi:MAG: hypothetical protein QW156_04000 [Candidatus Aenigmatarchaeota archaeon]